MSIEDALGEVVAACRDKLAAQDAEQAAIRRREAAYRLLHESGVPVRQIPVVVVERLRAEGFSDEQVAALGVSYSSARQAIERPRT